MAARLLPLAYGLLFAIGLAVSGMARPEKVAAFLDVLGDWDPSLAFVMLGAVSVYGLTHWHLRRRARRRPLLAARFSLPTPGKIDRRLVAGATVFGVGWGLSGFCPGPALTALGAGTPAAWWFVPAMIAGVLVHDRLWRRIRPRDDA